MSNENEIIEILSKEIDSLPSQPKRYTLNELRHMNVTEPFMRSIKIPHESTTTLYILHSTVDFDTIYGRTYVALPEDTDVNNTQIIEKYNLFNWNF